MERPKTEYERKRDTEYGCLFWGVLLFILYCFWETLYGRA